MSTRVPDHLLPHTVTVVRPVESTDGYGNQVFDYGPDAGRTSVLAWMQQDTRVEVVADGATPLQARWLMITNAAVHRRDRVEWPGHPESEPDAPVTFTLDGQPGPLTNPLSGRSMHHQEVRLKVVN